MNTIKKISVLIFFCTGMVLAETANAERYVVYEKNTTSEQPRDSAGIIEFSSENGVLYFLPSIFYDTLFVTVESDETGDTWCGVITPENRTMIFTNESGSYTLTCVTEDGTEYSSTFIQ